MRHHLSLYLRFIGISIRSQLQHRASFIMLLIAHFISSSFDILEIFFLFSRFKSLGSWHVEDVALLYGIVHVSFALAEGIARGCDTFSQQLKSGDFDRVLLRPCNELLQVLGKEIQLLRVGTLLQGLLVLLWGATTVSIIWTLPKMLLVVMAIIGGTCFFSGLFIFQAAISFWTTETLELMNILTYGGVQTGQYPFFIYNDWFRRFFTFLVPLAFVGYLPVSSLFNTDVGAFVGWLSPFVGFAFMAVAVLAWKQGVKRYCSTGS